MASSLRVGYLSTLYHTSHLLRQLRWIEQDLEVDCRWLLFGTGPEMVHAFDRHDIDIGYIGLPPALIGMARGVPLVCVGGGHVEGTVMVAGPSFRSLAESEGVRSFLQQFRNRRVGIPAAGSIHDVIFRALLMEHSIADVEVVNTPWADLIPYEFRKGDAPRGRGYPSLGPPLRAGVRDPDRNASRGPVALQPQLRDRCSEGNAETGGPDRRVPAAPRRGLQPHP